MTSGVNLFFEWFLTLWKFIISNVYTASFAFVAILAIIVNLLVNMRSQ